MKWPFFRKPEKSEKPLTSAQLAERLKQADAEFAAADQRVGAAFDRLSAERTPEALAAHAAAKKEVEELAVMIDVLERDHAAALQLDAEIERGEQEAALANLQSLTTEQAIRNESAGLAKREAEILIELAKVRDERRQLVDKFRELEQRRNAIECNLRPLPPDLHLPPSMAHRATDWLAVCRVMDRTIDALPHDAPLRSLLIRVRPSAETYNWQRPAAYESTARPRPEHRFVYDAAGVA